MLPSPPLSFFPRLGGGFSLAGGSSNSGKSLRSTRCSLWTLSHEVGCWDDIWCFTWLIPKMFFLIISSSSSSTTTTTISSLSLFFLYDCCFISCHFLKHIIIVTVLLLLLLLSHIFCDKPIWLDLGWHVSFLFFVTVFTESLILYFPNLGNSQLFGGMYRGMLALDDLIFVYR